MVFFVIWRISINKSFRIPKNIFAVPVSRLPEHFVDQPHIGWTVQVKNPPKLCKRSHEQLLHKVLQFRNRGLIRQRGI